jgi:VRR-NUC domain
MEMETAGSLNLVSKPRRRQRREEWIIQTIIARLLERRIDPQSVFWTALDNKPSSMLNGILQKKRGCKSGLPDFLFIVRDPHKIVWIEVKSRIGRASKKQKQIFLQLRAMGCEYWLVRSIRAAFAALRLSGVPHIPLKENRELEPWEGPFADPTQRLPQHPDLKAKQREYIAARRRDQPKLAKPARPTRPARPPKAPIVRPRRPPLTIEGRRRQTREAVRRYRERKRLGKIAAQDRSIAAG